MRTHAHNLTIAQRLKLALLLASTLFHTQAAPPNILFILTGGQRNPSSWKETWRPIADSIFGIEATCAKRSAAQRFSGIEHL